MSNYATLKAAISTAIKQNGNEEITGLVLQTTLLSMVDSLVSGYLFKGIATPSTVVGTPDENVFWIGGAGTYNNFGSTPVQVPQGCFGIFCYNGSFTNTVLQNDGVLNLSVLNASGTPPTPATYASLSDALATVPAGLQLGGMEITYIDSTTIKYVKYRLMATSWSMAESDWQGIDDTPIFNSDNLITSNGVYPIKYGIDNIFTNTGCPIRNDISFGTPVSGYYWGDGANGAEMVSYYNYSARALLYPVEVGQTLEITQNNENIEISSIAYAAYNESNMPYDGVSSRINFGAATEIIDNGDGTSTYKFIIPNGCMKVGLFYKNTPAIFRITEQEEKQYNTDFDQHIEDVLKPTTDILENGIEHIFDVVGGEEKEGVAWGSKSVGYYWSDNASGAVLAASTGYVAKSDLVEVNAGQILEVTVSNSIITQNYIAAYAAYDNDRMPYDGVSSRINFAAATETIDNGDGTTTYKFTIPNNCTQIGIFYKEEEVTFYLITNIPTVYNPDFDQHIEDVAGGGQTTGDISAQYYLKGASPKTFSKKIAIITAGQSNADGRNAYNTMPAEIQAAMPMANCHYIKNSENGAFAPLNITGNWAFDLVTYYNLVNTANEEIYVMKWTEGGTSIDPQGDSNYHWTADYEELSSLQYSLLRKFEAEIRNHIASDGNMFDIRAMLWHQGEGDRGALGTGSADRYYDNLRNMISYIRGIVGDERLPFITGTISHNSTQYDATIEAAQQRLAEEDPYFYLIDMSGAPLVDSYHFNAASSEYFGEMAYNCLIDAGVISGSKLTPVRPW